MEQQKKNLLSPDKTSGQQKEKREGEQKERPKSEEHAQTSSNANSQTNLTQVNAEIKELKQKLDEINEVKEKWYTKKEEVSKKD